MYAKEAMWECWRNETDMIIDGKPKGEQEDARMVRNIQEARERKTAEDRVKRYLMEQPNDWDRQLEEAYSGK